MDNIKVEKAKLIAILKNNRAIHEEEYNESIEEWEKVVTKALKKAYKLAKVGDRFITAFKLPKPKSFIDEYDKIIGMLEMSLDEEVELVEHEYDMYVRNNWNWKRDFIGTASLYNNKIGL